MNEHWSDYFRLGINHHLLFPASFESADEHRRTLPEVLGYPEFEAVDLFVPDDGEAGSGLIERIRSSGREPVYNCPLMIGPGRNPHSPDSKVRLATVAEVTTHLRRAQAAGSRKAVIASGPDPGDVEQRSDQFALFVGYVAELCQAFPGLDLLIEPFDRSIGKNLLIGSTREAAEVIRQVHGRGLGNAGLLIDMGHVPLMNETFAQALKEAAPYTRHIHLGSCVMRNPANPFYGDMHPPWGYPDGENDVPELIEFLRQLFTAGYLGGQAPAGRPSVTLEMRPYPGLSERSSVDIFLDKLSEAWKAV